MFPLRPPGPKPRGRKNLHNGDKDAPEINVRSYGDQCRVWKGHEGNPQSKTIFLPDSSRVSLHTALQRCPSRPPLPCYYAAQPAVGTARIRSHFSQGDGCSCSLQAKSILTGDRTAQRPEGKFRAQGTEALLMLWIDMPEMRGLSRLRGWIKILRCMSGT